MWLLSGLDETNVSSDSLTARSDHLEVPPRDGPLVPEYTLDRDFVAILDVI